MLQKLAEVDTTLTANSVEWCPAYGLEQIIGCGTYQLNQKDNLRVGSFTLFNWDGTKLVRILKDETKYISSGILDMKWKSDGLLSMATSSGKVGFLRLELLENELVLKDMCEVKLAEDESSVDTLQICLSIDWNRITSSVVVSNSLGQIGLVDLCEGGPRVNQLWKAHKYEAWIVCFGCDSNIVYSGGDDNDLHQWDVRVGNSKPCFTRKWHNMGVCSLQAHPSVDTILGSGSYDEQFALWDTRNMSKPLKHKSLGGGIWRIKWNTFFTDYVAAACMHNHFCVMDTHLKSLEPIEIMDVYTEHGSLAYGIDWCKKYEITNEKRDNVLHTLASCSFYDHSMHLWTLSTANEE